MKITLKQDDAKYWSVHTHSRNSAQDALPKVSEIVARAKELGYAGLGLTDHGNMAGSIELYMECMKAGIKPFPGSELYLVRDRGDKKAKRYHMGMVAYTTQGYRNLVRISTESHRNFHNKPLIDLADLARFHEQGWSEGIALTTGCFFGLVIQTLVQEGYDPAKQLVGALSSWFDTYIEIQNHDIDHEQTTWTEGAISTALLSIADDLDLPIIITQDSHYVTLDEKPEHETLKRLVSFGDDMDEAVFPGDGFHLADDAWMKRHHHTDVWERATQGLQRLLDLHTLRIPEADDYNYRVPSLSSDPDKKLRDRCFVAMRNRGLLKNRYMDRLDEELEVIAASRMGNYMLLVAAVCDHMTKEGIWYQTRGSAAGSLVCWLLGISNIDPLRWGARFDRFLSKDRTKPPDIDLDVENLRRREVMDWIDAQYSVSQICTWGVLGLDDNPKSLGKGSLKVKYFSKQRMLAQKQGRKIAANDWFSIPHQDRTLLQNLSEKETYSGYGVHACALVLVNSRTELEEMVPMQWVASSKTMVTQYDGPTIESIGLIKLDLLGSKTMSVLRIACENLGWSQSDLDAISYTESSVYSMIGKGDTDGCFQMEGYTTKIGCQEVKPRRIGEVIDIMALYRPGVMNSGATASYVNRKFKREALPERHSLIARNTDKTRGILLYQDQIITILRDLGMNPDDLTRFLKAVKASNKNVTKAKVELDYYMPIVEQMCRSEGMGDEDWAWLQGAFIAFAEYSFNVAHATVYGITAYRCAYLAVFHSLEFHAALLAVAAGTEKEDQYLRVTRRRGIKVKNVDLNGSGLVYRVDTKFKAVRKGFLSVTGLGMAAAQPLVENQPYVDWDDFYTKAIGTKITGVKPFKAGRTTVEDLVGTVKHLHHAGAFRDSFPLPLGEPAESRSA